MGEYFRSCLDKQNYKHSSACVSAQMRKCASVHECADVQVLAQVHAQVLAQVGTYLQVETF